MENSGESTARIPEPTALNAWLSANSWKLKPPVNNACIHSGKDFILMAVGGPNKRNDFHSESRACLSWLPCANSARQLMRARYLFELCTGLAM